MSIVDGMSLEGKGLRGKSRRLVDIVEKAREKKKGRAPFLSVSFPTPLIREVEKIVGELGYWPNKTAFMHEAVMKKLETYKKELEARRARESAVA